MLVRNNALVMSLNDPAPVLAALPQAKLLNFKGREIVAVRHTLDAAKVLNNLGLVAPSPILHGQYDFPGRHTPMDKQLLTAQFFTLNNRAFCFNEMRTGKTASALWGSEYLHQQGVVRKILIICPLSVMGVWSREGFNTITRRAMTQLVGSREKKLQLAKTDTLYHIINFDGLSSLYHEEYHKGTKRVKKRWSDLEGVYDLIIVDEADAYCKATNLRWKALNQIVKADTKLWMLTGTPTPNAPTDAYGLVKLLAPSKVPDSFSLFEEQLMRPTGPYKKVPRDGSWEYINNLMQPAIRFKRDECSLGTTVSERATEMTDAQLRVFNDVKNKMYHEDEGTEISAVNAAVKLVKLQQVMCGVVKDDDGNAVELNPTKRLNTMLELIQQAGSKTVVFVPFIASMHMIQNYLASKHISSAIINGDSSKTEREETIAQFMSSADPHVLIAHPKVAAHGLDLTAADTFIWFAPTFSTLQYEQANARGEGPNKHLPVGIYHIGCHPVEWRIYEVLMGKASMQSKMLDLYTSVFE